MGMCNCPINHTLRIKELRSSGCQGGTANIIKYNKLINCCKIFTTLRQVERNLSHTDTVRDPGRTTCLQSWVWSLVENPDPPGCSHPCPKHSPAPRSSFSQGKEATICECKLRKKLHSIQNLLLYRHLIPQPLILSVSPARSGINISVTSCTN